MVRCLKCHKSATRTSNILPRGLYQNSAGYSLGDKTFLHFVSNFVFTNENHWVQASEFADVISARTRTA